MYRELHHGIIYGEMDPLVRKSCIIFNRRYCLAPASVLLGSFNRILSDIKITADYDIQHSLRINRIIDTMRDERCRNLVKFNFKIVHEHNEKLYESDAFIVNIFKCRNIWNSFNDILRNFVVRSIKNDESNEMHKLLLSSFVILRLKSNAQTNEQIADAPLTIFEEITGMTIQHKQQQQQQQLPSNVQLRLNTIRKLENIESISTPFGNECFLNTINVGRIANIFGDNKCLMVASMPLVNGCEGGAVYNKRQDLIGIVISTTFDWNSEHALLTLVAKFSEIMAEFVEQCQLTHINIEDEKHTAVAHHTWNCQRVNCKATQICAIDCFAFENFIVLIQCADSWGSGCLVKINDMRLIITCAHVLENHAGTVRCTWKLGHFHSKIIFKNPNYDEAYDIAILDAPPNIPDEYFTRCHQMPTKIGQTVYASGFPHFTSLGKVHDFFPSIFEGRITKISNGVIFSDASVQSGQSGGALFNADGSLIGIIVSNSKDDTCQRNIIYPNINMSVPVHDILPTLQKYEQSKGKTTKQHMQSSSVDNGLGFFFRSRTDERVLHNLVANNEIKSVWALETPKILCKL